MEPINKIAKEKEPSPTINLDDTLDCSFSIPNIILEIISENNIEKSSEKCINIVLFDTSYLYKTISSDLHVFSNL